MDQVFASSLESVRVLIVGVGVVSFSVLVVVVFAAVCYRVVAYLWGLDG